MTTTSLAVVSVRRDTVSRELRLELADWRTRTGGVYDLPVTEQERLLLDGGLPVWGLFLPDFVIVLATGVAVSDTEARWTGMRVHVGGILWEAVPHDDRRRPSDAVSCDWHTLPSLLHGSPARPAAPSWLLDLIAANTPWGDMVRAPGPGQPE